MSVDQGVQSQHHQVPACDIIPSSGFSKAAGTEWEGSEGCGVCQER